MLAVDLPDGAPPFRGAGAGADGERGAASRIGVDAAPDVVVAPRARGTGPRRRAAVSTRGTRRHRQRRGERAGRTDRRGDLDRGPRPDRCLRRARRAPRSPCDASAPLPLIDWSLQARGAAPEAERAGAARRGGGARPADCDDAAAAFEAAASAEPANADAWIALGACQRAQQQRDASIAVWRRAVAAQPDNPRFHHELAVDLSDAGRLEQAAAEFAEVARLRPDDAEARFNLGATFGAIGRFDDEYTAYQAALAHRSRPRPRAQEPRGELPEPRPLRRGGHELHAAPAASPRPTPTSRPGWACSYFRACSVEEAIDALQHALQVAPTFVKAHFSLGVVYGPAATAPRPAPSARRSAALDRAKGRPALPDRGGKVGETGPSGGQGGGRSLALRR